jgi:acyl carrier protein
MKTVEERIVAIVAENSGIPASDIKPESNFAEDLGMDSLDVVETTLSIEEEFKITLPLEETDTFNTVADLIAAVEKHTR